MAAREDAAVALIEQVHAKLEELQGERVRLSIGQLAKNQHSALPHVFWVYGGISNAPADVIGSSQAAIYTDVEEFAVCIWHETQAECRATRRNLLRALSLVAHRPNVTIGRFAWLTEERPAWMNRGHQLAGPLTVRMPLPKAPEKHPVTLAEITGQDHTVSLKDEEVC